MVEEKVVTLVVQSGAMKVDMSVVHSVEQMVDWMAVPSEMMRAVLKVAQMADLKAARKVVCLVGL